MEPAAASSLSVIQRSARYQQHAHTPPRARGDSEVLEGSLPLLRLDLLGQLVGYRNRGS